MPARQGCRTGGRGRGVAGTAHPAGGYKDSPVAETEASGTDFAGTGADSGKDTGVGTGLSRGVGRREALRVRWSGTGEFGCAVAGSAGRPREGLNPRAGSRRPLGATEVPLKAGIRLF